MDQDALSSALGNLVPTGTSLIAEASDDSFWLPDDPSRRTSSVDMDTLNGPPVLHVDCGPDLQDHVTVKSSTQHCTTDTPTEFNPSFHEVPSDGMDIFSHVPVAHTLESHDSHGFDSSWQAATETQHGQSWKTALLRHDPTDMSRFNEELSIYPERSSHQLCNSTETTYHTTRSFDSELSLSPPGRNQDAFAMDSVAQGLPPVTNPSKSSNSAAALSTQGTQWSGLSNVSHSHKLIDTASPCVSTFVLTPVSNPTPAGSGVPHNWNGLGPFGIAQASSPPPVRPLTPYNYFFRFERDRLFQFELGRGTLANKQGQAMLSLHRRDAFEHYHWTKENSSEFQRQVLEDQWGRDASVKRKHVKVHGRISFPDLSRRIATEWKALPSTAKDVFREISQRDHERFTQELNQRETGSNST